MDRRRLVPLAGFARIRERANALTSRLQGKPRQGNRGRSRKLKLLRPGARARRASNQSKTEVNNMNTYKITRYRFNGPSKTIKTGLTLEEAQEHCQRADTSGDGWFDGYTLED